MRVPSRTRVACATPAPATQAMTPMHNQRTATRFMGVMPAPRLIGRTPCMRFANRRYQTRACRWPDIARLESEVSGKDLRDGRIVREPQLKRLYVARRHGASEVKFVGLAIAGVPDADLDAFRRLEASDHQIARGSIDVRRTLVEFNGGASRFGLCGACGRVARQRREQAAVDRLILNVCLEPMLAPTASAFTAAVGSTLPSRTSVMLLAEP